MSVPPWQISKPPGLETSIHSANRSGHEVIVPAPTLLQMSAPPRKASRSPLPPSDDDWVLSPPPVEPPGDRAHPRGRNFKAFLPPGLSTASNTKLLTGPVNDVVSHVARSEGVSSRPSSRLSSHSVLEELEQEPQTEEEIQKRIDQLDECLEFDLVRLETYGNELAATEADVVAVQAKLARLKELAAARENRLSKQMAQAAHRNSERNKLLQRQELIRGAKQLEIEAREKAELEAKEKAEQELRAKKAAEIANEQAAWLIAAAEATKNKQRCGNELLEQERLQKERAEQERLQKERAEQERLQKERAEQERLQTQFLQRQLFERVEMARIQHKLTAETESQAKSSAIPVVSPVVFPPGKKDPVRDDAAFKAQNPAKGVDAFDPLNPFPLKVKIVVRPVLDRDPLVFDLIHTDQPTQKIKKAVRSLLPTEEADYLLALKAFQNFSGVIVERFWARVQGSM
ncbi:hypothetical protein FN846DRAFT_946489 [Sphaerosporella brunnea]|uniref:Uncharacterized protein n=1 Tax=Sphaerosporella brunnea TaxID=1250544 RepID=A0A5J5EYA8_9PEZI|nr:hypothetical protein FN846DRAFT_946489 [Sphaerosporella brunnea]